MPQQFYYKKNRLQQLRGFYYAAQIGNVSKAAEQMSLTQSTVSLQIQSLERDLKVQLFDRSKKKFSLTPDGETLYKIAVPLIQGIDGLYEHFHDARDEQEQSTVDIAAHHIAISYLLPEYLKTFTKTHPKVEITIRNISRQEALERLKNNEIDIMLYPTADIPDECNFKPSFSYQPTLIMHKDNPLAQQENISLEDIAKHNLIRIDQKLITLPLFEEAYKTYNWGSNIKLEAGHWEMLKHFIKHNLGIAMVSTMCLVESETDIVSYPMTQYFPEMTYGIMTKKGTIMTEAVTQFIAHMDPNYFE